jgi:hypothetical protein
VHTVKAYRESWNIVFLLIIEASRSHSDKPQLAEYLWTSDQPVAETSTWQHKTQESNVNTTGEVRTRYPEEASDADPRLRRRAPRIDTINI